MQFCVGGKIERMRMKSKDFSIFEFRKLTLKKKELYFKRARKLLPGDYTESIIEVVAANLWAKDKAEDKKI
jgi:hypothetical protein